MSFLLIPLTRPFFSDFALAVLSRGPLGPLPIFLSSKGTLSLAFSSVLTPWGTVQAADIYVASLLVENTLSWAFLGQFQTYSSPLNDCSTATPQSSFLNGSLASVLLALGTFNPDSSVFYLWYVKSLNSRSACTGARLCVPHQSSSPRAAVKHRFVSKPLSETFQK